MNFLKKIFSMKTYAVLYTLFLLVLCLVGSTTTESVGTTDFSSFLDIYSGFALLLGLVVTYAVGWKKKLFSNATVAGITIFYMLISFLSSIKLATLDIANGTTSQLTVLFVIFFYFMFLLLCYLPAFIASIIYFAKSKDYEVVAQKKFSKILFPIFGFNMTFVVIAILYNVMVFNNVWDYVDIICGALAVIVGICYAWNIKLYNKGLMRLIVLLCAIEFCLPLDLFSTEYSEFVGANVYGDTYVGFVTYLLITVFTVIIMYRYAFTKEIYKPIENSSSTEEIAQA